MSGSRTGPRQIRLAFPVTLLMAVQFVGLYILPRHLPGASPLDDYSNLVNRIFALVLSATFLGELLFRILGGYRQENWSTNSRGNTGSKGVTSSQELTAISVSLSLLAFLGLALTAYLGIGAYAPLGSYSGPLVSVGAMLAVLQLPAVAIAMLNYKAGRSKSLLTLNLALCALGNLALSLRGGLLINLADFIFLALALAITLSAVSLRYLLVGALITALCWPVLFQLRNERRYELANIESNVTLVDRLRQDGLLLQMNQAAEPEVLKIPSDLEMLRYVIPRPLDPTRPVLDIGPQISYAISGSFNNSNTFSQPGNIYYLRGGPYLFCFYFLTSLLFNWLLQRQKSLYAVTVLSSLTANLIWVGPTFPATIGGFLQGAVYGCAAIFALSKLIAKSQKRKIIPSSAS